MTVGGRSREGSVGGGPDMEPGDGQQRYSAVLRAEQQLELGAAQDDRLGALLYEPAQDVPPTRPLADMIAASVNDRPRDTPPAACG